MRNFFAIAIVFFSFASVAKANIYEKVKLALNLAKDKKHDLATKELEEAFVFANKPQEKTLIWTNQSYIYRDAGRFEEAIKVAQNIVSLPDEIGYERAEGIVTIAEIYVQKGEDAQATRILNEFLEVNGIRDMAKKTPLLALVQLMNDNKEFAKSEKKLSTFTEEKKLDVISLFVLQLNLARTQIAAGKIEEASKLLKFLINDKGYEENVRGVFPEQQIGILRRHVLEVRSLRAALFYSQGELEKAKQEYSAILESPNLPNFLADSVKERLKQLEDKKPFAWDDDLMVHTISKWRPTK